MSKLKECPFCGSNDLITDPYYEESAVRCQKCKATGPEGLYKECQDMWNKRSKMESGDAKTSQQQP